MAQEHEVHKLLDQIWVDAVAGDADAVEERLLSKSINESSSTSLGRSPR
jgi:hypothetical protein